MLLRIDDSLTTILHDVNQFIQLIFGDSISCLLEVTDSMLMKYEVMRNEVFSLKYFLIWLAHTIPACIALTINPPHTGNDTLNPAKR